MTCLVSRERRSSAKYRVSPRDGFSLARDKENGCENDR